MVPALRSWTTAPTSSSTPASTSISFASSRDAPGRTHHAGPEGRRDHQHLDRLWQLRHGLRAFPGGPVDPDFAQLRPARSRVGEMSRTKSVPGIALGRWCTLGQTHYCAVDPAARVPRPVSDSKMRAGLSGPAPHVATPGLSCRHTWTLMSPHTWTDGRPPPALSKVEDVSDILDEA
jgi:hypothetical protein